MINLKIYLVRHGQCNSNLNKTYNRKDEDLNKTGIEQANKQGYIGLLDLPVDAIFKIL
mgnify:CR=1 FL=1